MKIWSDLKLQEPPLCRTVSQNMTLEFDWLHATYEGREIFFLVWQTNDSSVSAKSPRSIIFMEIFDNGLDQKLFLLFCTRALENVGSRQNLFIFCFRLTNIYWNADIRVSYTLHQFIKKYTFISILIKQEERSYFTSNLNRKCICQKQYFIAIFKVNAKSHCVSLILQWPRALFTV